MNVRVEQLWQSGQAMLEHGRGLVQEANAVGGHVELFGIIVEQDAADLEGALGRSEADLVASGEAGRGFALGCLQTLGRSIELMEREIGQLG